MLLWSSSAVFATNWLEDRTADVRWGNSANWSGVVPNENNSAIIISTQATTYDIDVNVNGVTRLLQVGQEYTFNDDGGSLTITRTPAANFDNVMYNTTSGGTVTYHAGMTMNIAGAFYAQMYNNNGGTTVFNNSFTLNSGSLLNVKGGRHVFNGDLSINGTLRLDGTVLIGGHGTTVISTPFMNTAGPGSELYLNRTGAYTVSNPSSGYLRVERSRIYFGADQAVGAGTGVRVYGLEASTALISSGNFRQEFGWLGCEGPTRLDLANTAAEWTFADSSSQSWDPSGDGALIITNAGRATIRFAIDSAGGGTGLTEQQIGQITLNGKTLTSEDVEVKDGYLYITQGGKLKLIIIRSS
jgi:hypothetical protein